MKILVKRSADFEEINNSTHEDDSFGGVNTVTQHTIHGLTLSKDKYKDIDTDFEVKRGVPYYLLYAIYSTGDTFNHHEGANIEFLDLYQTREAAEATLAEIKAWDHQKMFYPGHKYEYTLANGKKANMGFCPWFGYFESLNKLEVIEVYLVS